LADRSKLAQAQAHEPNRSPQKIATFESALKARGATSLYLFGSTARNEAGKKSDLDLFLDYDPKSKFNALDLVAAKRFLQRGPASTLT
jgi:predicted nucleotidyltransferase